MTLSVGMALQDGAYVVDAVMARSDSHLYVATHITSGRLLWLKILGSDSPQPMLPSHLHAAFLDQMQALATQPSPQLPNYLRVFEEDRLLILAMEAVAGDPLSDRIAAGPMPLKVVLPLLHQIADGLQQIDPLDQVQVTLTPDTLIQRPETDRVVITGFECAVPPGDPWSASPPENFLRPGRSIAPLARLGLRLLTGTLNPPETWAALHEICPDLPEALFAVLYQGLTDTELTLATWLTALAAVESPIAAAAPEAPESVGAVIAAAAPEAPEPVGAIREASRQISDTAAQPTVLAVATAATQPSTPPASEADSLEAVTDTVEPSSPAQPLALDPQETRSPVADLEGVTLLVAPTATRQGARTATQSVAPTQTASPPRQPARYRYGRWIGIVAFAGVVMGLGFGLTLRFLPRSAGQTVRFNPNQSFPPASGWPGEMNTPGEEANFDAPYLEPEHHLQTEQSTPSATHDTGWESTWDAPAAEELEELERYPEADSEMGYDLQEPPIESDENLMDEDATPTPATKSPVYPSLAGGDTPPSREAATTPELAPAPDSQRRAGGVVNERTLPAEAGAPTGTGSLKPVPTPEVTPAAPAPAESPAN